MSRKKLPKPIRLVGRSALMVVLLITQPLIRHFPWKVVWVLNAGTEDDVKAFGPAATWLSKRGVDMVPLGFFWAKNAGLSIYLASPYTNKTFKEDPVICQRILEQAQRWNAKKIALNGVIPAAIHNHKIWPDDNRFVLHQHATIFMVGENVKQVHEQHSEIAELPVAVLGAGYTGREVANRLCELGHQVVTFDPRRPAEGALKEGVEYAGEDFDRLNEIGTVVVLTGNGDDAAQDLYDYLKPGAVILSDTHPKISGTWVERLLERDVHVYESALTRPGARVFPKLPRWNETTIAGCVGQALVECVAKSMATTQAEFDTMAQRTVQARLDIPNVRRPNSQATPSQKR